MVGIMKKNLLAITAITGLTFIILVLVAVHHDQDTLNYKKIWEYSTGDSQRIAFIDTGIVDEYADELDGGIVGKYNIIDNNENVCDGHGHGTQMVSVCCGNGYMDVYGCARDAELLIVKAVSDEGKTNNDYLLKALEYAENNDATVVCIALGGFKISEEVTNKIYQMIDNNISIVAAAGDYGNKELLFPANVEGVISVEAGDGDRIWDESNSSESSVLRFPGVDVLAISLDQNRSVCALEISGTSVSCAMVCGYIACVRDYYEHHGNELDNGKLVELLGGLNTKSSGDVDYCSVFK